MKTPLYSTLETLLNGDRDVIVEGIRKVRLAITRLQDDHARPSDDDIIKVVALLREPHGGDGEYRRTHRWLVDYNGVHDGAACDGRNEFAYGVAASESMIAKLLVALAGAVRAPPRRTVARSAA